MSFSISSQNANTPRFGRGPMPTGKAKGDKPEETALKISDPPKITLADYDQQVKKLADKRHGIPKPFGNPLNNPVGWAQYGQALEALNAKQATLRAQLTPEILRGAMTHLPALSRQNLARYLTSPQLAVDLLSPDKGMDAVMRNLLSKLGPPIVKHWQVLAQEAANTSDVRAHRQMRKLERELKDKNAELKWLPINLPDAPKGTTKDELKTNQERAKELKEEIETLDTRLASMRRSLPLKTAIMPLLDAVPPAPYEQIKPALDETVADFNKAHAHDPIVHVDRDTLGAGSMAQVHRARTQSGKPLIVKVFRPEASKDYLDDYHRFTQFMLLFMMGGTKRAYAAKASQNLMEVFKEEVSPQREQLHARRLKARMQREKLPIRIPQVLSLSKTGFVEEFVEGENLSRLAQNDRAKAAEVMQTLGPALVKSFFLWPERYLDPQGGNLKAPAAIFDYGRMTLLAPRVNQTLNDISKIFFLSMANEHKFEREKIGKTESQKEKLEKKEEEKNQKLSEEIGRRVKSLLKPGIPKNEISNILEKFFYGQFDKAQKDLESQSRKLFHSEERDLKRQQSFFLGLFQNLAELNEAGKTVKLTEFGSPLTRQDVSHGREKLRAVMLPYFEYAQKNVSDAVLEAWLRKEGDKQFGEFKPYLGKLNGSGLMARLVSAYDRRDKAEKAVASYKKELKPNLKKDPNAWVPEEEVKAWKNTVKDNEDKLKALKESPGASTETGKQKIEEAKKTLEKSKTNLERAQNYLKNGKRSLKYYESSLKRNTALFADLYQRALRDDGARQTLVKATRWSRQLETLAESLYTDLMKGTSLAKEEHAYLITVLKDQLYREYQPTVRDDDDDRDDD